MSNSTVASDDWWAGVGLQGSGWTGLMYSSSRLIAHRPCTVLYRQSSVSKPPLIYSPFAVCRYFLSSLSHTQIGFHSLISLWDTRSRTNTQHSPQTGCASCTAESDLDTSSVLSLLIFISFSRVATSLHPQPPSSPPEASKTFSSSSLCVFTAQTLTILLSRLLSEYTMCAGMWTLP